ncbi:MAG: hypothetical protein CM15mV73_070 [Caudoviricetes sp.]|nr:MAG: hypothetical protein CM15mV73_070 [Caudoviricetes sp.]
MRLFSALAKQQGMLIINPSTLDALSVTSGGTVLADDSLVVCLQALKRYAKRFEHIGANINIKTFDKPE